MLVTMRWARRIAQGILFSPIILIVLGFVCTYIPGAPAFLNKLFWQFFGKIEVFQIASEVLEGGIGYSELSADQVMGGYIHMISGAVLDSAVLGTVAFLVKAVMLKFNQKYEVYYTQPRWLATVIGIVMGVIILTASSSLFDQAKAILSAAASIGCMLFGIWLMLGKVRKPKKDGTYASRLNGTIMSLLFDILENMLISLCAVSILTCTMEGPRMLANGGNLGAWFLWAGISVGMFFVLDWISAIRKQYKVTYNN